MVQMKPKNLVTPRSAARREASEAGGLKGFFRPIMALSYYDLCLLVLMPALY